MSASGAPPPTPLGLSPLGDSPAQAQSLVGTSRWDALGLLQDRLQQWINPLASLDLAFGDDDQLD
jgi:hypothetical protein